MERIKLRLDLNKLIKGYPIINLIAEYESKDIKLIYGIKDIKIKIKNKDHRNFLYRTLKSNIEVDFFRSSKRFKAYLRLENKQFYLNEVNFYEEREKSLISIYNGHKRRLFSGLVRVAVFDKKYLLFDDILRQIPDSEYFIVFRKNFYKCKKVGENIYFSYREKLS